MDALMNFLVSFIVIGAGGFMFMMFMNSKYPLVRFITFRGNIIHTCSHRRLYGRKKLVPPSILKIITQGERIIGENIDDFEEFEVVDKTLGIFTKHSKGYIAYETNSTLIKMDTKVKELDYKQKNSVDLFLSERVRVPINYDQTQHIEFAELKASKDIASGYINTIDDAGDLVRKRNPIMDIIIGVIPLMLVIATFFVGLYAISTIWLESFEEISTTFYATVQALKTKEGFEPDNVPIPQEHEEEGWLEKIGNDALGFVVVGD